MADGPLDHALETDRLLQDIFAALGDLVDFFLEEPLDVGEQVLDAAAAVLDNLYPLGS
jgi:hypothetical protein